MSDGKIDFQPTESQIDFRPAEAKPSLSQPKISAGGDVPYPANSLRDLWDTIKEAAGEAYNKALGAGQRVNEVLNHPSEQVYKQLTRPSPGVDVSERPGVKTVSGLIAGVVDPRNLPFMMMGQPEVGPLVRAGAGATLAGFQGEQAGENLKRKEYGQAAVNLALAGLGAHGALSEGSALLRESPKSALGVKGTPEPIDFQPQSVGSAAPEHFDIQDPMVSLAEAARNNPDLSGERVEPVKNTSPSLKEKIVKGAERYAVKTVPRNYQRAMEEFSGQLTLGGQADDLFVNAMRKAVPDVNKQNAILVWAEAGGNDATLAEQAAQLKAAGKPAAKYYELAQNLTDQQKTIGRNVQNYLDSMKDTALKNGVIQSARDNYIPRVTRAPDAESARRFGSQFAKTTPHGRARVFPTRFDAEMANYKPQWDGMNAIVEYGDSVRKAIATRELQKTLLEQGHLAPTGMTKINAAEFPDEVSPTFIRPGIKPQDIRDYRAINHPAFQTFRFAAKDAQGNPIFYEAPLAAHPDVAWHLKNVIEPSDIDINSTPAAVAGRAALKLNTLGKRVLFSFSPFHMISEGTRALGLGANPFALPEIDLSAGSTVADGVRHGLTLFRTTRPNDIAEGLTGEGLFDRVPGLGNVAKSIETEVWDYANRAKAESYKKALARNLARYGNKMPVDDIASETAKQVNELFGGLNHLAMGRDKNFQKILRLALIAPDFEEGNLRFAGRMFAPGIKGAEARRFFALQSGELYLAARMGNALLNNGKLYTDKPFSIVHNGREYDLRTAPGDVIRLFENPANFINYRRSPIANLGGELLEGRNQFGQPISAPNALLESVKRVAPIPTQAPLGLTGNPEESLGKKFLESLGSGLGIHDYKYRSPAEKILHEAILKSLPATAFQTQSPVGKAVNHIRKGDVQSARQMVKDGKLSAQQFSRAMKIGRESPLVEDAKRVPVSVLVDAYKKASRDEQRILKPTLLRRAARAEGRMPLNQAPDLRTKVQRLHLARGR